MTARRADELLYDSEATLRLVDNELVELGESTPPEPAEEEPHATGLAALPQLLVRFNSEINGMLRTLRETRTALEQTTVHKIQITHDKLKEVSSATEVAATDILDALDRTQALLDQLDQEDSAKSERSVSLRASMRDELFDMMGKMQFQDITSQQLAYASSILVEMERRLADIAVLFDLREFGIPAPAAPAASVTPTFDPHATLQNAEARQKVADEVFLAASEDAERRK